MSSYYRQQLEFFLSELDVKAGVVLDIGGAQKPVKGRTKSWDVKEYKILDLPEFDLQESGWYDYNPSEKIYENKIPEADVIFCLEVFDYIDRPDIAIVNITELLKDEGKAYITFPFIYPHHNELEREGLRYTEQSIYKLATNNKNYQNLQVKNIWYRRDRSGLLKQFYADDGMRAAKEYPHHDVTGFIVEMVKS